MAHLRGSHCCCWACVPQSTVGIVEKFGSYDDVIPPGCTMIGCSCCGASLAGVVSLRTRMLDVYTKSATTDNVLVEFKTIVVFRAIPSESHTSYYALSSLNQIRSYIDDAVRGEIARLPFEEIFIAKERISNEVRKAVYPILAARGFDVDEVLVQDIRAPRQVVEASELRLENYYNRQANNYRAEMNKVMVTKRAEAESEVKRLQGVGAANMQAGVSGGMGALMTEWESGGRDTKPSEIIAMMLMQSWMDTMKGLAAGKGHAVMMPSRSLGVKMV
jgi:regulator of protease activity HflC (stomatin/prohibitin superfamily)